MLSDIQKKETRSRLSTITAVCFMLVLVGVGTITAINNHPGYTGFDEGPVPLGDFRQTDTAARPYTGSEPEGLTEDSVKIFGYTSLTIPANATEIPMLLLNPEGNLCNFAFELVLTGAGEALYASGLVGPGYCIEDVELARGLPVGEYKAALNILMFEQNDYTAMGSATAEFDLIAR